MKYLIRLVAGRSQIDPDRDKISKADQRRTQYINRIYIYREYSLIKSNINVIKVTYVITRDLDYLGISVDRIILRLSLHIIISIVQFNYMISQNHALSRTSPNILRAVAML